MTHLFAAKVDGVRVGDFVLSEGTLITSDRDQILTPVPGVRVNVQIPLTNGISVSIDVGISHFDSNFVPR